MQGKYNELLVFIFFGISIFVDIDSIIITGIGITVHNGSWNSVGISSHHV